MKGMTCTKYSLFAFALVALVSCSGLFDNLTERETFGAVPATATESGATYIVVRSGSVSRTVLPDVPALSDLTDFVLTGKRDGGATQTLGESSYATSVALSGALIPVEAGTWEFTLAAKKGTAVYRGTQSKTVSVGSGENALSFTLSYAGTANTPGSFDLQFVLTDTAATTTHHATGTLTDASTNAVVSGYDGTALSVSGTTYAYSGTNIPVGTYECAVSFYTNENILLSTWRTIIIIASGQASTETIPISSLKAVYTITYNDGASGTLSEGVVLQKNYTQLSSFTLPVLTRTGYAFDGWYEGDTRITEIAAGTTGNKTLTAHWTAQQVLYMVQHWRENADDDGYTLAESETQELMGITDTTTVAVANSYTGFVAPTADALAQLQQTIAGDGSTTIAIRYTRKKVTYTLELDLHYPDDAPADNTITGKYGAPVVVAEEYIENGDYWEEGEFLGWNPELPVTFGTEDARFVAQWERFANRWYIVDTVTTTIDGESHVEDVPAFWWYKNTADNERDFVFEYKNGELTYTWRTSYKGETIPDVVLETGTATHDDTLSTLTLTPSDGSTQKVYQYHSEDYEAGGEKDFFFILSYEGTVSYTDANGNVVSGQGTQVIKMCEPAAKVVVSTDPSPSVYSITYELNGGTNADSNPDEYADNTSVTLAHPTRVGYVFDGWYTTADFAGEPITQIATGGTDDITLYAKWEDPIGSVILRDGTRVKYADVATYTFTESNPVVAVIAFQGGEVDGYVDTYAGVTGTWYGVGLQQANDIAWANDMSQGKTGANVWHDGMHINFSAIRLYDTTNAGGSHTYTGDTDGSDNWAEICKQDTWNTTTDADIEAAYPAFHWALHYAETAGLTGSAFADGWYIPSATEVWAVYNTAVLSSRRNGDKINSALHAVGGTEISTGYCSSNQYPGSDPDAWDAAFATDDYPDFSSIDEYGNIWGIVGGSGGKTGKWNVLVIRAFAIH